ncbi:MAG TPA: hypothetical protein VEI53_10385 [Ktedonobacteraceae bacterium]|nr:hypothetical protein [Ktedonobacteraceae bacterium]
MTTSLSSVSNPPNQGPAWHILSIEEALRQIDEIGVPKNERPACIINLHYAISNFIVTRGALLELK